MDCEVEILKGAFRSSIKSLIGDVFSPLGSVDLGRPLTRGDDLADHVAEDVGQPEIAAGLSGVMERFPNLTQSGGGYGRSIPWQEPCLVAQPLTEFWAKGTGASKIENRSLTPFPSASIAPRS